MCIIYHTHTQYKTINIGFGPLSGRPDEMYIWYLLLWYSAVHTRLIYLGSYPNKKIKKWHNTTWRRSLAAAVNGFLGNTNGRACDWHLSESNALMMHIYAYCTHLLNAFCYLYLHRVRRHLYNYTCEATIIWNNKHRGTTVIVTAGVLLII